MISDASAEPLLLPQFTLNTRTKLQVQTLEEEAAKQPWQSVVPDPTPQQPVQAS